MCHSLASTVSWPSPVWHFSTNTHTTYTLAHINTYTYTLQKTHTRETLFISTAIGYSVCTNLYVTLDGTDCGGGRISQPKDQTLNLLPWEWKGWTNWPPEHWFSPAIPPSQVQHYSLAPRMWPALTRRGEKEGGWEGGGPLQWQSLFGGKLTSLLFLAVP